MNEEQYLLGQFQQSSKKVNERERTTWYKIALCLFVCGFIFVSCVRPVRFISSTKRQSCGSNPSLLLQSPGFQNGTYIPSKYGCASCKQFAISVPLTWELHGVSSRNDMTFLLLMHDPDALNVTGLDFIHWFVINISDTVKLPENASGNPTLLPQGSIELRNSNNRTGYHAPCPPDRDHTYVFRICLVHNLSNRHDWTEVYDAGDVVRRLEGSLCGILKGTYPRGTPQCKYGSEGN